MVVYKWFYTNYSPGYNAGVYLVTARRQFRARQAQRLSDGRIIVRLNPKSVSAKGLVEYNKETFQPDPVEEEAYRRRLESIPPGGEVR